LCMEGELLQARVKNCVVLLLLVSVAKKLLVAGDLSDLFVLNLATLTWNNMNSDIDGTPPFPRHHHGFSSANGLLYVFGGWSDAGQCYTDTEEK
jgi:hypothetical protein